MSSASHIADIGGYPVQGCAGSDRMRFQDETSRILAEASHDLRQPVQALGLHVAELRRKISGREQQHLVGKVERSVDAISALIDALFDVSRLNAGRLLPRIQPCELSGLLERIDADFRCMARALNIRLIVRPFCGSVRSDPVLLERIAMNLVSNALRYTRDNGTVLIACRKRVGHVLFEVRDNGIGIEKSHQADIFREFFHLDEYHQQGLGLGLAIVDRLSKSLGHQVALRSAPGRGSKFTLQLRSAKSSEKIAAQRQECRKYRGRPLTGKRVLLAVQDAALRCDIAGMLGGWGCEISDASSITALDRIIACGAGWDVAVCGGEVGAELIARRPDAYASCIRVCGCGADEPGALRLGKPVKPAKLRSLVQFALDKRADCD